MALDLVPPRHIAAIVTHLEMRERPRPAPMPDAPFQLKKWPAPSLENYRTLFRRVGEDWMWFSRAIMADDTLAAIIHDPGIEVYAVLDRQNIEVGMLELDFRYGKDCEIGFFGLIAALNGKGHGHWLMAQAKMLGWRKGVERLWVHTCTLDHPAALRFYIKSGFTPFKREVEIFPDPRLTGHMPRGAAKHIPILE